MLVSMGNGIIKLCQNVQVNYGQILNVRFFRSLLWIFSLYHLLFSYLLCVLAFFLSLGGQKPVVALQFYGCSIPPRPWPWLRLLEGSCLPHPDGPAPCSNRHVP